MIWSLSLLGFSELLHINSSPQKLWPSKSALLYGAIFSEKTLGRTGRKGHIFETPRHLIPKFFCFSGRSQQEPRSSNDRRIAWQVPILQTKVSRVSPFSSTQWPADGGHFYHNFDSRSFTSCQWSGHKEVTWKKPGQNAMFPYKVSDIGEVHEVAWCGLGLMIYVFFSCRDLLQSFVRLTALRPNLRYFFSKNDRNPTFPQVDSGMILLIFQTPASAGMCI